MTKTQLIALVAAAGVGASGGAIFSKATSSAPASLEMIHALRIEAPVMPDGGLGADKITAYRTRFTSEKDGGLSLADTGPAMCTAPGTTAARDLITGCKMPDAGTVKNVYVLEARGSDAGIAVEAYGSNGVCRGVLSKPAAFQEFLDSLSCVVPVYRSGAVPL